MFDPSRAPPSPQQQQRQPVLKAPPATITLAIVLVLIHLLLAFLPEADSDQILLTFAFIPQVFLAALDGQAPLAPALWPLASHLFLHLDPLHLITNCGFLLAFASPVERRWGWLAFLAIFLATGIVGALAQTWLVLEPASRVGLLLGASGGIFGLMGTTLMLGPQVLGRGLRLGPIIVVLMAINVGVGLLSEIGLVGGYLIGWQAHLGGFLAGLAIGRLLRRAPDNRLPREEG
jgi:membrane associated rhomboid family serine protease